MESNFMQSLVIMSFLEKNILKFSYLGNHRLLAKRERVEEAIRSGDTKERDRHGFAYFRYVSSFLIELIVFLGFFGCPVFKIHPGLR